MIIYDFENGAYIRRYPNLSDFDDDSHTYYSKDAVRDILNRYKSKLAKAIINSEEDAFIPEMPTDYEIDDN